jgi:hypothetical protein
MDTEPVESLMARLVDQYNRRPEGWRILVDQNGNILVISPSESYKLKIIHLNPQEYTGVGIKIEGVEEIRRSIDELPTYGFRPITDNDTKELLNSINRNSDINNGILKQLLGTRPVTISDLEKEAPKAVLTGPVIAHPNLSTISREQRELEAKLAFEADKLFRKKYPERASIYI